MVSATAVFAISYHGCCGKITGFKGANYVCKASEYSISYSCITFLLKSVSAVLLCPLFPVYYNGVAFFFRQLKFNGHNGQRTLCARIITGNYNAACFYF